MIHIKQLDGLRCVAIVLVLIAHFTPWGARFDAGHYGVELFFVISGFLITSILQRLHEPFLSAYKTFIGRRTLRIFPIYYLTVFALYFFYHDEAGNSLIYCLTHTYNYAEIRNQATLPDSYHFWSLSVEEQFYLVWPFLVLLLRRKPGALKIIIAVLIMLCAIQLLFDVIPGPPFLNRRGTFPAAMPIGVGALGAIFYREGKFPARLFQNKWCEPAAVCLLAFFLYLGTSVRVLPCAVISLYFVLQAIHGFNFPTFRAFIGNKWVVYIGAISYGIYLYHVPVGTFISVAVVPKVWNSFPFENMGIFGKLQYNKWLLEFPLDVCVTLFVSFLSFQYIEKPFLSLKDKWFGYPRPKASGRKHASVSNATIS